MHLYALLHLILTVILMRSLSIYQTREQMFKKGGKLSKVTKLLSVKSEFQPTPV